LNTRKPTTRFIIGRRSSMVEKGAGLLAQDTPALSLVSGVVGRHRSTS
jgi:hypothetical protein